MRGRREEHPALVYNEETRSQETFCVAFDEALSQKWGKNGNFGVAKYKNIKKNRAQEVVKRDGVAASVNTAVLTLPA